MCTISAMVREEAERACLRIGGSSSPAIRMVTASLTRRDDRRLSGALDAVCGPLMRLAFSGFGYLDSAARVPDWRGWQAYDGKTLVPLLWSCLPLADESSRVPPWATLLAAARARAGGWTSQASAVKLGC